MQLAVYKMLFCITHGHSKKMKRNRDFIGVFEGCSGNGTIDHYKQSESDVIIRTNKPEWRKS